MRYAIRVSVIHVRRGNDVVVKRIKLSSFFPVLTIVPFRGCVFIHRPKNPKTSLIGRDGVRDGKRNVESLLEAQKWGKCQVITPPLRSLGPGKVFPIVGKAFSVAVVTPPSIRMFRPKFPYQSWKSISIVVANFDTQHLYFQL